MRSKVVIPLLLIIELTCLGQVRSDFYTSISGLEDLLYSEEILVETFEAYMKLVQLSNRRIKSFLDNVEQIVKTVEEDPNYFENPFNALKTLQRFATDWKKLESIVISDQEAAGYKKNVAEVFKQGYVNATKDDLLGASKGIARLQSTYSLDAENIAAGILLNWDFNVTLTAHDCLELGVSLYNVQEYKFAAQWLLEARILLKAEFEEIGDPDETDSDVFPYASEAAILEYLAPTMFNLGNSKAAKLFNDELLVLEPDNEFALANKELFESKLLDERQLILNPTEEEEVVYMPKESVDKIYEKVCREELRQSPAEQRDLFCRYATKNISFNLIAPFKMEEISHDPFVALYHDAVYESEMLQIINATEDYVERSKVGDLSSSTYSDVRTSKNTWLYYDQHSFLAPLKQRLQDITGLNLLYAEPLQVANYGIGGHYGPHYDFSDNADKTYPGQGNRILTALSYINEVELGGGTAFPFLKILVPPIKGSLLVWYNMHESLELDYRTRHAGCPVLKGSKWICNEWFHQVGQEFVRPCSLKLNGRISRKYKNIY